MIAPVFDFRSFREIRGLEVSFLIIDFVNYNSSGVRGSQDRGSHMKYKIRFIAAFGCVSLLEGNSRRRGDSPAIPPRHDAAGGDHRHRAEARVDHRDHAHQPHGRLGRGYPQPRVHRPGFPDAVRPGVSIRTSGPGMTEFEMRGVASNGGNSPTVGFYFDETPLTAPAATNEGKIVISPDLYDLNRVEVLRGPQGTLYGSGSMGGTIGWCQMLRTPMRFNRRPK